MKARLAIAAVAALALTATLTVGIVGLGPFQRVRSAPGVTSATEQQAGSNTAILASRAELARLIGQFERRATDEPNPTNLKFLAQMYLQRGRLTGDVATYTAAQAALEQAGALAPEDGETQTLLAGLAATSHDFAGAARASRQLVDQNPKDLGPVTVLGDALLELGQYDEAAQIYGRLSKESPESAAAIVRQARLVFLHGDAATARLLARRAKEQAVASAFSDAGLAFYTTFEAQLENSSGNYEAAAAFSRQALQESPGYYVALAGLARDTAALGHIDEAIAMYERAIAVVPQPETLSALGDLQALRGDSAAAAAAYDTVAVIGTLAVLHRQVFNRAIAVHDADHGTNIADAVRLAEGELASRQDVYGYDVYAWCLYQAGRYTEAAAAADRALALGTPDARLHYHAGMIAKARHDDEAARFHLQKALSLSPNFDPLQAPRAVAALTEVQNMTTTGRP